MKDKGIYWREGERKKKKEAYHKKEKEKMDGLNKKERNRRRKIEEYKWRPTRI